MKPPVMILLAGPNGAGKSSLFETQIAPQHPGLPFINADQLAAEHWPCQEMNHAYEASSLAAQERERLLAAGQSFATETVFSHPSKLELIGRAQSLGFAVWLMIVYAPLELSLRRVHYRVRHGGHAVPEQKVRERFERLWPLLDQAVQQADRTVIFENTTLKGHQAVALATRGMLRITGPDRPWLHELLPGCFRP
ncbi:MAG: zeta toxin family protein [Ectothiorhodospiraceae bacterium]|nr:zeta toxin family protein [Ectothiorhodospiraceae bacterium]MCH8503304.1 zeta toxin family protein [Ectothiorhodospiraceae bacterium]